jgi:hypothetical protein
MTGDRAHSKPDGYRDWAGTPGFLHRWLRPLVPRIEVSRFLNALRTVDMYLTPTQ